MPRVLVADDSKVILRVINRLLTASGLEVALAASGEQAMAWLAKERPDLTCDHRKPCPILRYC